MASLEFGLSQGSLGYGTLIAEQEFDNERGTARGPERSLMSALLFDGVVACINYASVPTKTGRSRFREASNWVWQRDEDYVFSFENVCNCLGINPDSLRIGLMNLINSRERPVKKSRRTSA